MNKKILGLLLLALVAGGVAVYTVSQRPDENTLEKDKETVTLVVEKETDTKSVVGEVHTVVLTNSGFSPENISVKMGEAILWTNESGRKATVDSDFHPSHLEYPPLNLGTFEVGESVSLVFDEVGTFTYHNHLQPSHTGEVTVE